MCENMVNNFTRGQYPPRVFQKFARDIFEKNLRVTFFCCAWAQTYNIKKIFCAWHFLVARERKHIIFSKKFFLRVKKIRFFQKKFFCAWDTIFPKNLRVSLEIGCAWRVTLPRTGGGWGGFVHVCYRNRNRNNQNFFEINILISKT